MFKKLVRQFFRWHGVDIVGRDESCCFVFDTGEKFETKIKDSSIWKDMSLRGSIGFSEGFVDEKWDMAFDQLEPFLRALNQHGLSRPLPHHSAIYSIKHNFTRASRSATPGVSHKNSAHHYDQGNELFASFLDDDKVYSCGFFDDPTWGLGTAQRRKLEVTLDRLQIYDGAKVLDIGCGWGTLAIEAARRGGQVTGINLAQEQVDLARRRTSEAQSTAEIVLADYRDFARDYPASFDRVVAVGMIEHVGKRQLRTFFDSVRRLLKPGGLAVVHSIVDWPFRITDPWLEQYIFPGGYVPRSVDLVNRANSVGLRPVAGPYRHDGVNYATTLAHWRRRFLANYDTLDGAQYPERFKRLWVLYLAGCEAAFCSLGLHNAQVVYQRPD